MTAKWHNGAESREMARANGWVMVRRPGGVPYTVFAKEWDALPAAEFAREMQADYQAALARMALQPTKGNNK